jgi:phosphoserine aminotransferase
MTQFKKPSKKPSHPYFGSGPCNKVSNWDVEKIKNSFICRSHRSAEGLKRLNEVVSLMRVVLNIPDTYFLGIIPGSATGAIESAIWNLIGQRPLSVLTHDAFSLRWESDIVDQLKIKEVSITRSKHGDIPQTENIPEFNDILLNWNGSTSGACFPFSTFKNKNQDGLIIADITSAAFCMEIPWSDLDASAFSWQKGLGGEAGIGVLVLSPKAINRLVTYKPSWPVPYLLQLRDKKGVKFEIFQERT